MFTCFRPVSFQHTGLLLGIAFGLLIPGRMEFLLPAIGLVSGLYMNALRETLFS